MRVSILSIIALSALAFVSPPSRNDADFVDVPAFNSANFEAFQQWIYNGIEYPEAAIENGINGTVIVSFIVEKDGRLSNIEVVTSPDKLLSDAVVARISQAPRWEPAREQGVPIRLKYSLPIIFRLSR